MPILGPFGGRGGGGGFTLGPAQNVFTGANRAAAETARDDYETDPANSAWLPQYNADTNLNIRLEFGTTVLFQVRNSAGNAWLDNDSSQGVQGPLGPQGDPGAPGQDGIGVDFTGFADGDLVRYDETSGTTAPAAINQTADRLESTMPVAPPGERALDIGAISAVSGGSTVSFLDRSRDKMFGAVVHDTSTGAVLNRKPFYFSPEDTFSQTPFPVNTSETFTATTLQFSVQNTANGTALEYRNLSRVAGAAEITGCNLTIRRNSHTDTNPVFDYIRDVTGGDGFTLNGGAGVTTTTIDLQREYLFLQNETLYITVTGQATEAHRLIFAVRQSAVRQCRT